MTESDAKTRSTRAETNRTDVEKAQIHISPTHYLTLTVLASLFLGAIGTTYAIVRYVEIGPLTSKAQRLESELTAVTAKRQEAEQSCDHQRRLYTTLLHETERIILTSPPDGASLIGKHLTFEWDYHQHTPSTPYIVEVRQITSAGTEPIRFNVLHPDLRRRHFELPTDSIGEFLWRVRPGILISGEEVAHGSWSPYGRFTVYPSLIDRIKASGRILVASTPTTYGPFTMAKERGGYEGFDIDLLKWIVKQLGQRLDQPRPIEIEVLNIPFSRLFLSIQNGEVDMAIRSITKSVQRESNHPGLRFTDGYLLNHQILIQQRDGAAFPEDLKEMVVGAKRDSTNERAALYLASQFAFTVDASFVNYGDIYKALREGRIDFGLVDSALVTRFLSDRQLFQLGPYLDEYLHEFFLEELGFDEEQYAIALYQPNDSSQLLEMLNEILRSRETRTFLGELAKEYGF